MPCNSKKKILVIENHPFQMIETQMKLSNIGQFLSLPAFDCAESIELTTSAKIKFDVILCSGEMSFTDITNILKCSISEQSDCLFFIIGNIKRYNALLDYAQKTPKANKQIILFLEKPFCAFTFSDYLDDKFIRPALNQRRGR